MGTHPPPLTRPDLLFARSPCLHVVLSWAVGDGSCAERADTRRLRLDVRP